VEERRADAGAQGQGQGREAGSRCSRSGPRHRISGSRDIYQVRPKIRLQMLAARKTSLCQLLLPRSHCLKLLTMSKPRLLAVQNHFSQRIWLGELITLDVYKTCDHSRNFFDETLVMWVEHFLANMNITGPDRHTTVRNRGSLVHFRRPHGVTSCSDSIRFLPMMRTLIFTISRMLKEV
jgi:hypothetical protein